MFFIDPMYLVFIAPGLLLALWASWRVKRNFAKYAEVGTRNNYNGVETARLLLDRAGLQDVRVVRSEGMLSDHYNPVTRELALSDQVYDGRSIAAIGVAAHEAGHALQHAQGYFPLWVRSLLVPTANIGSSIGYIVMFAGLFIHPYVVLAGIALFSAVLVFQLVTLPVEFDATARAKRLVVDAGIIAPYEREGMDKVLDSAALTYVAGVISTLMVILYYLWIVFSGSSR